MAKAVECPGCGEDVPTDGTSRPTCPSCGETVPLPFAAKGPGGDTKVNASRAFSGGSGGSAKIGREAEDRVVQFYRNLGCRVYEIRPMYGGKGISKGIPDLRVFAAEFSGAPSPFWFHEVKAGEGARPSPEQREFRRRSEEAGIPYVLGGAREAAEFLGFEVG